MYTIPKSKVDAIIDLLESDVEGETTWGICGNCVIRNTCQTITYDFIGIPKKLEIKNSMKKDLLNFLRDFRNDKPKAKKYLDTLLTTNTLLCKFCKASGEVREDKDTKRCDVCYARNTCTTLLTLNLDQCEITGKARKLSNAVVRDIRRAAVKEGEDSDN